MKEQSELDRVKRSFMLKKKLAKISTNQTSMDSLSVGPVSRTRSEKKNVYDHDRNSSRERSGSRGLSAVGVIDPNAAALDRKKL